MKLSRSLLFLGASLLLPTAWSAPLPITIPIDESTANPTVPSGVTSFFTGAVILCEAFGATGAFCSGSDVSDLVVFSLNADRRPVISYFSDLNPGQAPSGGAEIGIPNPLPDVSTRFLLETMTDAGTETLTYIPTSTDPGGSANASIIYEITSDVAGGDTPEPATMTLFGLGLVGLGIWRARLRR